MAKSFRCSPTPHRRWPPCVPDIDANPIRLRFAGTPRGFEQAFLQLRGALDGEETKPDVRARYHIELVFEEIIGNIVRHGAPQGRDLRVAVVVDINSDGIALTFEDDGIPFDPCNPNDAGNLKALAEPPDGGFGLKLVRRVASSMRYERAADLNRLVVTLPVL